jgi:hypothetical protein
LILVANSSYSQRIRIIGKDTFVTFTVPQANAINDTFLSQRKHIYQLKTKDSLNIESINQYKDSLSILQSQPKFKPQTTEVGAPGWIFLSCQLAIYILFIVTFH